MQAQTTIIALAVVSLTIYVSEVKGKKNTNWMEPGEHTRVMGCVRECVKCMHDGTDPVSCYNQHDRCMDLHFDPKQAAKRLSPKVIKFKSCFVSLDKCVQGAASDSGVNACALQMRDCIAQGESLANLLSNLPPSIQRITMKYLKCKAKGMGNEGLMADCARKHIVTVKRMGKMQLHRSCFYRLKRCPFSSSPQAKECLQQYHKCLGPMAKGHQ